MKRDDLPPLLRDSDEVDYTNRVPHFVGICQQGGETVTFHLKRDDLGYTIRVVHFVRIIIGGGGAAG